MNDYLGYIVWHSLSSNALFDLEKLTSLADGFEVNVVLPSPPIKANLFKRACKQANFKYEEDDTESGVTKRKVYVEPLHEDSRSITREIRAHRVNKTTSLNTTTALGTVVFDKKTMQYEIVTPEWGPDVTKISEIISEEISKGGKIDHLSMRNIVRSYIEVCLDGLWLRSGTYFIEENKYAEAMKLYKLCYHLGSSNFRIIPLVDEKDQQLMILDAYRESLNKVMDEFKLSLETLRGNRKQPTANQVLELENLVKILDSLELKADKNLSEFKAPILSKIADKSLQEYLKEINTDG